MYFSFFFCFLDTGLFFSLLLGLPNALTQLFLFSSLSVDLRPAGWSDSLASLFVEFCS